jgi:hypothetical protein
MGAVGEAPNALRSALVASAMTLVLLSLPAAASAANPPACDTSAYPVPFLVIDGKSVVVRNTRYLQMRQNTHSTDSASAQSDPEHPFPLTVTPSTGGSTTYTVNDWARDQFPVTFASGETADVTATYVEVHNSYSGQVLVTTRCTRTVSASFSKPPVKRHRHKHHRHRHRDRNGDDDV